MNITHTEADITRFVNGELCVKLKISLEEVDAVIVQSAFHNVNDKIIELFLLVDAVKRAGAKNITLVAPYLAYSRSPNSIEVIVNILKSLEVSKILTLDLHSEESLEISKMGIINVDTALFFASVISPTVFSRMQRMHNSKSEESKYNKPTRASERHPINNLN